MSTEQLIPRFDAPQNPIDRAVPFSALVALHTLEVKGGDGATLVPFGPAIAENHAVIRTGRDAVEAPTMASTCTSNFTTMTTDNTGRLTSKPDSSTVVDD